MIFNANFINISAISWWSVLLRLIPLCILLIMSKLYILNLRQTQSIPQEMFKYRDNHVIKTMVQIHKQYKTTTTPNL